MIYLGADHRGYELKEKVKVWLIEQGYEVEDVGNFLLDPEDDYIDPAVKVAEMVEGDVHDMGILICGSGHGVELVANRFPGVRAVMGYNNEVTIQGREHEDANVLTLPSDWVSEMEAMERVELFLRTEKSVADKYVRRRSRVTNLRIK